MSEVPTVYVVDDDAAMRRSTCLVLARAGLAHEAFDSAEAFLAGYVPGAPGCLVLDLHMPGIHGLELVQRMRAAHMMLPVAVVSGTGTVPAVVRGMRLGVEDFLEKPVHPEVLVERVRAGLASDASRIAKAAELQPFRDRLEALTRRERELLKFLVDGLPNKLIARSMGISIKTVENHRARLMLKTGASNAADLVRMHMTVQASETPAKNVRTSQAAA